MMLQLLMLILMSLILLASYSQCEAQRSSQTSYSLTNRLSRRVNIPVSRGFQLKQFQSTSSRSFSELKMSLDVSETPIINSELNKIETQYELSPQQFVYVVLTSIFITCLILADVIGVKLFDIQLPFEILGKTHIEHTCGMITFPITFVLGDIINEYYGSKAAKRTVYIGLAMSIFVFLILNISQAMPYLDKPFNVTPESFDMIFGSAKLMYVASVSAYLVGSLSDIWLFGVIKKATKGKLLWLRATVSYIAFSLGKAVTGQTPATIEEVLNIATTGYGLKFALSFAMTPFLYILKSIMSEKYGLKPFPAEETSS